ncbi:hypothetical protein [Aeromicrobium sp. P5_D10]
MIRTTTLTKASAAAVAMVLLASTAAIAGPTTYITVNGSKAGTSRNFEDLGTSSVAFVTDYGVNINCTNAGIRGTVTPGASVLAGTTIGEVTNITATCLTGVLNMPTNISMGTSAWTIKVRNTPANAGDPIDVTITNMSWYFYRPNCEFFAKAATGVGVHGTLYPGVGSPDARLTINSIPAYPLELTAYSGTGGRVPASGTCGGEILTGDLSNVNGDYALTAYSIGAGPISHAP